MKGEREGGGVKITQIKLYQLTIKKKNDEKQKFRIVSKLKIYKQSSGFNFLKYNFKNS